MYNARTEVIGYFDRTINTTVVGDNDFTVNPIVTHGVVCFFNTGCQRVGFIQARHDDRQLNHPNRWCGLGGRCEIAAMQAIANSKFRFAQPCQHPVGCGRSDFWNRRIYNFVDERLVGHGSRPGGR